MFSNKDMLSMIFPIWLRAIVVVCIVLMLLGIKEVVDIVNNILSM